MDHGNGLLRGIYVLSEWISRFFYANVLWILFTIGGLCLFGFFPSTVALFALTRKWLLGETDIPLFRTFWETYRKEFIRVNFFGFILLFIGFLLYWDIDLLRAQESTALQLVSFLILGVSLVYMIIILYILPIYVHFEFKFLQNVKFSMALAFTHPLWTLVLLLSCGLVFFCTVKFPSIFPFFSGSLSAFMISWIVHRLCLKIDKKSSIETFVKK